MQYRFCLLLCCCLILGCGSPKPYDVRAVVTLNGEPLVGAEVTLISLQRDARAKSAFGTTDEEGQVTFKTGDIDGVFSGSYIAVVSQRVEERTLTNNEIRAFAEVGIRYRPSVIELIPERYTRSETSNLRVRVGYWRSKDLMFNLQSE